MENLTQETSGEAVRSIACSATCGTCKHFKWHGCGDTKQPENRRQHLGKDGLCPHVAWPKGWWPHLMANEPACSEWYSPNSDYPTSRQHIEPS